eukprot:6214712-Pleurochrysis_carterae.AAC.2
MAAAVVVKNSTVAADRTVDTARIARMVSTAENEGTANTGGSVVDTRSLPCPSRVATLDVNGTGIGTGHWASASSEGGLRDGAAAGRRAG